MKKGEIQEGIVEIVKFPNKGIIMIQDEPVIVKNVLPKQKIRFVISKKRKGCYEGRVLEVIESSPLETRKANCSNFGLCGGCTYQTIPYKEQLLIKQNQVKQLLDEVITYSYKWEEIIPSPSEWGYRNKMEFSFGDAQKGGELCLGLHKKGSFYDILTISDCCIVQEDYNKIVTCVLTYFQKQRCSFYHKITHKGYLRHLLIRRATKTGELLISIVTSTQELLSLTPLAEQLQSLELEGKIVGILHIENDRQADVVQSDRTIILYGQDYFYEELLGLKFKISTFSFFQTNSLGAEKLYERVREYIGETKDKVIFDLYSGTGTIAQILSPVAKKVIGVEIVEEAVQAAKENARLNQLDNCEFIVGDVLKVIDTIEEKPDFIVLDPPREGVHPKALTKIGAQIGAERIVYISCKPTSLVRDLEILQNYGYVVEKSCCIDMFPQVNHVETCVLLSHKNS